MTDHDIIRRLARDHWVRVHGNPRITFLVGGARARLLWTRWSALTGIEATLIDAAEDVGPCIQRAFERAAYQPSHAIAVLAPEHAVRAWREGAGDRERTMLDESCLIIPDDSGNAARPDATNTPTPSDGSSGPTLDARSMAEAILFEALEANAATKGRFELNGYLSVHFGTNAAEVDLLDRQDAIAVEIDGYHHFTDADAYRRDRRKDVLLQSQGLFVIRLLAEDVMRDTAAAVNAVCEALAFRSEER